MQSSWIVKLRMFYMHIAAGVPNNALYLFTQYSLVIRMKANVTSPEAELLVFR